MDLQMSKIEYYILIYFHCFRCNNSQQNMIENCMPHFALPSYAKHLIEAFDPLNQYYD